MSEVNIKTDACTQKIESVLSDHIADCNLLSATALKAKYKLEYSSWRNMKQRKKIGAVIAHEFADFNSFLRHVGPRPAQEYSIDRLDNENPKYGPGLCAWRTKTEQNRNKRNVQMLTDANGTRLPLTVWAEKIKVSPRTLYQRKREGLSDVEVLHGRKSRANPLRGLPWPVRKARQWEKAYQSAKVEHRSPLNETREEFLLRKASEKVQHYRDVLDATMDPNPDAEVTEQNERDLSEYNRWLNILQRARQARPESARRKFLDDFSTRKGGLGRARELELIQFMSRRISKEVVK